MKLNKLLFPIKKLNLLLDQRSDLRHHRIKLAAFSSIFTKALSIILILVSTPLILDKFGMERFGLWMAISSTIAMLGFADMGISSGLMNVISSAYGKDDIVEIRAQIGLGVLMLFIVSTTILLIFFFIYPYVNWASLFNVETSLASEEVGPVLIISIFLFALTIPASLIYRVLMGLQDGLIANLWSALGNFLSLLAVLSVIYFDFDLRALALGFMGPPLLVAIIANINWFYKNKYLLPTFKTFNKIGFQELTKISILFFVLQISGLIAFQSDSLIISHYLGAKEVGPYSIALKLFSIPTVIISFYLNAIWPAYTEANSRGDVEWVLRAFIKALRISAIVTIPFAFILLIFGGWIINKWIGPSVNPGWDLMLGLFFWTILSIFGGNFAALLNGLNIIKFQIIVALLMAISNLFISILLVKTIGISGVIWGSVITILTVNYIPTAIFLKRHFKNVLLKTI